MAIEVKHKFVSQKSDGGDASLVRPSNWNDTHEITIAASRLMGRAAASAGAVQEISLGGGLVFNGTTLENDATTKLNSDGSNVPAGGFFGLGEGASVRVPNIDAVRGTKMFGTSGQGAPVSGADGVCWQIEETGQRSQIAIMTNTGIYTRTDDAQSQPGTFSEWQQIGTGGTPWAVQPIGVPIPVFTNLSGVSAPPNGGDYYRYIKLTANDSYNSGLLGSQSISGSAPLLQATARITDTASPLNGQTVRLINTERRVLRAGAVGTVENDQMQEITGNTRRAFGNTNAASQSTGALGNEADSTYPGRSGDPGGASSSVRINFNSSNSPGSRTGNETRPKNIGVDYYMRIR